MTFNDAVRIIEKAGTEKNGLDLIIDPLEFSHIIESVSACDMSPEQGAIDWEAEESSNMHKAMNKGVVPAHYMKNHSSNL